MNANVNVNINQGIYYCGEIKHVRTKNQNKNLDIFIKHKPYFFFGVLTKLYYYYIAGF